ncbi:Permease of the drug/metabolite transporter (DMT) superfamily [Malonomonas rubra DSM 5091]|uniref:Permease of the drug/metabolite transporter (DMT) superfamily n=1 Tax=Malonomonas rubra DSM 5091 TaxID=1122189 RepID=A0A1M6IX23_MALRU|nr:EamA family transporter [Malonomonas rubra]SHJ38988.1 Permease of the drug/metabolite transporter (DMT) superfamily [Malonomonas rubra DSM 5091]
MKLFSQKDFNAAYLLLLLPPLFWAGNTVLARGIADLIPPVAMSFWRWTLALTMLAPFTWKQVARDLPQIRQHWQITLLISLFGISSFNTLLYTAAQSTTALNIALTQSVMPAIIVGLSYLFYRDRISRRQFIAVHICIAGAIIIVFHGDLERLQQLNFVTGDLLMLLAVCFYALYSVLLRKRPQVHPLSFLTVTFMVGVVSLFPLYLWELSYAAPLEFNRQVLFSLLYVGLCPSILAYLFWNRGIEQIGVNKAGLYINLIPLFASLMAIIFLGEQFQGYHLYGILLIVSGLLIFNWPDKTTA